MLILYAIVVLKVVQSTNIIRLYETSSEFILYEDIEMEENMEMSTERKMEYYRKLIQYYRRYLKKSVDIDWEWDFENK